MLTAPPGAPLTHPDDGRKQWDATIFPRTPPWTALPKVPYNMGKLENTTGGVNLIMKLIKPSVPKHWRRIGC